MRLIRTKTLIITLVVCILFSLNTYASNEALNTVSVHFDVPSIATLTEGDVSFELYDESGKEKLATSVHALKRGEAGFNVEFSVPEYFAGEKFVLRLTGGAKSMNFINAENTEFTVETYSYPDENGGLKNQTRFYMQLNPNWNKEAVIKVAGHENTFFAHCFLNGELFVTTDLLDVLKINYKYDAQSEHPNIMLSDSKGVYTSQFFMNNIYAVEGGNPYNLETAPFTINDSPYVPLAKVATYFACSYEVLEDTQYGCTIKLAPSAYAEKNKKEIFVNSRNITSKTDYLIWVSKSDYSVNVFLGSNGNWRHVKSFDCAIGAPSTPTIEGSFEYYRYQDRWSYASYYCGPVLRFYNGYAIHSTLIRYNGVPYDNRVGVKISHGCVRVRPEGINWLAAYIPLHTRILVTA